MKTKSTGIGSQQLAVIDIGTNTFRLLIAEVHKRNNCTIKEIHSERIITRLGQGIYEKRLIKKDAINRSIAALKKFKDIIQHHHVRKTAAVATSALREAKNSGDFLKKVEEMTGLKIRIISGKKEAKITYTGMLIDIAPQKTALMTDIGGGSTELIFARNKNPILVNSLNLGVVYLADKYMKNDPPLKEDLNQMDNEIFHKIMLTFKLFSKLISKDTVFIGTAGTVTALAASILHLTRYEHSKIHNSKITIQKVRKIFSDISTISAKKRLKYFPLEPSRLDIIVPGTLILLKLMETFGFKKIIVSDNGLREGILLDLYRKSSS